MSISFIHKLFSDAQKRRYALGAFNFSNSEILKGIFLGAHHTKSPIIVEASEGEQAFFFDEKLGAEEAVAIVNTFKKYHKNKMILHADHHKSFEAIKTAIDAGYPSVHIDASEYDYEKNVRLTKKVVDYAHKKNVWVEGELGHVAGTSTLHKNVDIRDYVKGMAQTDPYQAREFVQRTGVNALAIMVGNAHGLYKGTKQLDFDRIAAIKKTTKAFLVLHGGSGTPDWAYQKAIKLGINKINVNTEMRVAFAKALHQSVHTLQELTPYKYMANAIEEVRKVVEHKLIVYGARNKL
ncbi:MAG TPA: class II fructose-bisphosphate aldolase [Candidatus Nanoarchaeia archaeon]|nr:class II fructose-bisphosphate aldolase [Candidatus Nanoarchaeia archaeon]